MIITEAFFIFTLLIIIGGCFSHSANQGELNSISFRYYLGKSTSFEFQEISEKVLSKHGYKIDDYDNGATYLSIDSHWKNRLNTSLELDSQDHNCKTQILLTATIDPGATSKFTGDLFSCYMDVISLCFNGELWAEFYNSPALKVAMDKIANDIKDEYQLTM